MKYTNVYIWSGIDRLGTACISFLCNIVLARLLSTDDFGIIGMVAIFFSIAYSFTDCGLSDGLIKMEAPRTKDYGTVFVFNLSVGTIIAILDVYKRQSESFSIYERKSAGTSTAIALSGRHVGSIFIRCV